MAPDAPISFPGFPDFRANVTYTPRQFFTVVLPNCSSGTVRIVGYALRQVLGWVDEDGNPTRFGMAVNYALSKRTSVYTGFNKDNKDAGDWSRVAVGVKHTF